MLGYRDINKEMNNEDTLINEKKQTMKRNERVAALQREA
jgi:hypothetical protein